MGTRALVIAAVVLVVIALWFFLRKPKAPKRSSVQRRGQAVSSATARSDGSAELPEHRASAAAQAEVDSREVPKPIANLKLLTSADLDEEAAQRVDAICVNMPEPHPVQRQIAGGLDTPDELADVVASDAGLTASILRTVNSAAFSLASPITSVRHAINYLGMGVVKGLVAQAAVAERGDEGTPEQQAALARIWKSACAASAMAQILGQEMGIERPSVLATRALFFNLGDVALTLGVEGAPDWYSSEMSLVDRIDAQQAACSANTAIVGSSLARLWNLPDDIALAIDSGLVPLVTAPAEHPMQGEARKANILMYLAGRIGDRVAYQGLRDIGELDLVHSEEPDLFYVAGQLRAAGLERVLALLGDPAFRRKANKLLEVMAG